MVTFVERGGIRYIQTSVQVPAILMDAARERGYSINAVLSQALEKKLEENYD